MALNRRNEMVQSCSPYRTLCRGKLSMLALPRRLKYRTYRFLCPYIIKKSPPPRKCSFTPLALAKHPSHTKCEPCAHKSEGAVLKGGGLKRQRDDPPLFSGLCAAGFSVACLIFARLARSRSPFTLMGVGLGVWCFSSVLAGLSRPLSSYYFLLLAR